MLFSILECGEKLYRGDRYSTELWCYQSGYSSYGKQFIHQSFSTFFQTRDSNKKSLKLEFKIAFFI